MRSIIAPGLHTEGGGDDMMTVDEEGKVLHSGEERFGCDDEDFCSVAVEKRSRPLVWWKMPR